MASLQACNLAKRYGARQIVIDVSLEVASEQVVGLLGPNGAGKTTCFTWLALSALIEAKCLSMAWMLAAKPSTSAPNSALATSLKRLRFS